MRDSFRRPDITLFGTQAEAPQARYRKVTRWCIVRGDGSRLATQRLYTAVQARRFVRLATRWGIDVYAANFGKITIPA